MEKRRSTAPWLAGAQRICASCFKAASANQWRQTGRQPHESETRLFFAGCVDTHTLKVHCGAVQCSAHKTRSLWSNTSQNLPDPFSFFAVSVFPAPHLPLPAPHSAPQMRPHCGNAAVLPHIFKKTGHVWSRRWFCAFWGETNTWENTVFTNSA